MGTLVARMEEVERKGQEEREKAKEKLKGRQRRWGG